MPNGAWSTADELAALLETQRDALNEQIESLRATQDTRTDAGQKMAVLCDYLITGSSPEAAAWANDMGWKATSRRTGAPCAYTSAEVLALLESPPPEIPPTFIALARRLLRRNRKLQG